MDRSEPTTDGATDRPSDPGGTRRPLRIAYITGSYPKASHTFIQREIAGLRRRGIEVLPTAVRLPAEEDLIGPEERAARAETFYILRAARNPIRLIRAHIAALRRAPGSYFGAIGLAWRTTASGLGRALYQLFYLAEAGLLAEHLRELEVDQLHNHFMDSSCTVAMLASRLSGIPFSTTVHGPTEFFAAEQWHFREKIAEARFLACISHFCRSQCMLFSDPADWERLHIIHCGVEPARYGARPAREAGGPVQLVFVGRLAAVKGVRVLLEALARVRGEVAEGVHLTLVGGGSERTALEGMAASLGIAEQVEFTGYLSQTEVAERLETGDIFVLPSFAEGVPVVLMEAMASGLPVIATRVGGVGELVEDGVNGLVVAPSDVAGLADAIATLARDPAQRSAMGAAGRARVREAYDIDREAGRLAALFAAYRGSGPVTPKPPLRPADDLQAVADGAAERAPRPQTAE